MLARGDWVAEGRDIGTVVAPAAELKVFLTAEPAGGARGVRETAPMAARVPPSRPRAMRATASAPTAPLEPAADAIMLDTTGLKLAAGRRWIVARAVR